MVNLTVVDINDNCAPVTNAAVVIWHCDASGNYSEYGNSVGKSFLRGVQMTDANGLATFKTIYPGWYSGRTTHIHFQVFLSSHLAATSQMAFPEEINSQVYDVAPYATRGQKDTSNNQDGIFSDTTNTQYEIPIMTGNTTAGYTAHLTVGVPVPTSGVITLEPETGGQFTLAQNVPNPISKTATVVPFMLKAAADVTLDVFDVNGKLLFNAFDGHLDTGAHRLEITQAKTLTSGSYLYRLSVTNSAGTFAQCKIMTVL
jgi:hypothetical protein